MNAQAIADLTTAGGTMVLAVATYFSTRSANRASRVAERAMLAGLRPVLMHARLDDPVQKVGFSDDHWVRLEGPGAAFDVADDVVYLAIAVRNVGSGIAVLQGWSPRPERVLGASGHEPPENFRPQSRDIYVAPGDVGFWQGAIRGSEEPLFEPFAEAQMDRRSVTVDLLYTDMHGGQRSITRFSVLPMDNGGWLSTASRHWVLDGVSAR